jgi:hypothetical protein
VPISLDTTVGGASANSYASQAEYGAYIATRFPPVAWAVAAVALVSGGGLGASAASDLLNATLIAGARELDNCFNWRGQAVIYPDGHVQARSHPRTGLLTRNGLPLDLGTISIDLKNAQCEFALQLNVSDLLGDIQQLKQHVASVKAGSVQVNFQQHLTATYDAADIDVRMRGPKFNAVSNVVPDEVRRLLVPSWFKMPQVRRRAFAFLAGTGRGHGHEHEDWDDDD